MQASFDATCFCMKQVAGTTDFSTLVTHYALAKMLVKVMRIPCFGRRMTIGLASIV